MADEEHLKILKKGVEAWNAWREKSPKAGPFFQAVDLRGADLRAADLSGAILQGADLRDANLRFATLVNADLFATNLAEAVVSESNCEGAVFFEAVLHLANFSRANLVRADLRDVDLTEADLSRAILGRADLSRADLKGANLSHALFGNTNLGIWDLSETLGLESTEHFAPSILGVNVLRSSGGQLPAVFLKGCGLSDWEIEAAKLHNPHLTEDERTAILYEIARLQGHQPIQLNPLFLSYSSADAPFVEALEPRFDKLGVRYWRDVHDLKAGRLETQIDRAIRLNPTVLLVLSEKSVESDWVEWEVGQARELEKELKRDVLCPVALDDAWKTCSWPGVLRRQIEDYHILDFSAWREKGSFEGQFGKLLEGLKLFYRGEG